MAPATAAWQNTFTLTQETINVNLRYFTTALILVMTLPLSGCLAIVAGGAAAGGYYVGKDPRTVGEIADDATITARIKTRLIEAKDIKALDINVDTFMGNVTLKGKVRSASERARAIKIAKGVTGVKKVISKLAIVRVNTESQSA